ELVIYDSEDFEPEDPGFVTLELPNGRKTREVVAHGVRAERLLQEGFESLIYLGEYQAVLDTATGIIEAQVSSSAANINTRPRMWTLPGVQNLSEPADEGDDQQDEVEVAPDYLRRPEKWRLAMESHEGEESIEFCSSNLLENPLLAARASVTGIRLIGFRSTSHDEALAILESYANAALFEIDVLYGMPLSLQRRRTYVRRSREERAKEP